MNLIQENLKGAVLSLTDTKTSGKSAMKALGWNNPATIAIAVDTEISESVTGGIKKLLFNNFSGVIYTLK